MNLGGVTISRAIFINRSANWGRWLDTFTNTTKAPLTIKVAFGGQSGLGATGGNASTIVNTSSGDANVAPGDAWVEVATPLDTNKPDAMVGGPQITVTGRFDFAGNWLHGAFDTPLSTQATTGTSRCTSTRLRCRRARAARFFASSCSVSASTPLRLRACAPRSKRRQQRLPLRRSLAA